MQYSYAAFVFHQRADGQGPMLALFRAGAAEVSLWSDVDRLGPDNRSGPQREPKKSRINSIKRFFSDDAENTIPTAIVVGLRGARIEGSGDAVLLKIQTIDGERKPGLIIDGQHRLRGLEAASPSMLVPGADIAGLPSS